MGPSDTQLIEYLTKCDAVALHSVVVSLKSKLSGSSGELAERYPTPESIPNTRTKARKDLAQAVVGLLRWYASDSIAFLFRKVFSGDGGIHYHEIVRDVANLLNGRLSKKDRVKIPKAASVAETERVIIQVLLRLSFKDKSQEEIAQVLKEAGLEKDAAWAAAKKYGAGLSSVTIPVLTKILGKKTVKVLIERIMVAILSKTIGKEAASAIAKRLLIQVSQKAITRFLNVVGWILAGLDVLLFTTSPAKRMTVPTVALIAVFRERDRL